MKIFVQIFEDEDPKGKAWLKAMRWAVFVDTITAEKAVAFPIVPEMQDGDYARLRDGQGTIISMGPAIYFDGPASVWQAITEHAAKNAQMDPQEFARLVTPKDFVPDSEEPYE